MSEAYANAQLSARADERARWSAALAPTVRPVRTTRRPGILARLLALFA